MKMERTMFFRQIYDKSKQIKQLDGTNIMDGFNCNTNLDIGVENINNEQNIHIMIYIAQFNTFAQVDTRRKSIILVVEL